MLSAITAFVALAVYLYFKFKRQADQITKLTKDLEAEINKVAKAQLELKHQQTRSNNEENNKSLSRSSIIARLRETNQIRGDK